MKILVLLQNAWRRGAEPGETSWLPRDLLPAAVDEAHFARLSHRLWVQALWNSKTGRRLTEMLPVGHDVVVGNASPFIGGTSRSKFPIDTAHVAQQLERQNPDVVLLLGEEAQKAADLCAGPVVLGPHPAWRLLSKEMTSQIRASVELHLVPA